MKIIFLLSLLSFSIQSLAQNVCDDEVSPHVKLYKVVKEAVESMYVDLATIRVKSDGKGKLGILYEKDVPKDLMLKYKDLPTLRVSFDDLKTGKPLIFENAEKVPGPAIILARAPDQAFGENGNYKFVIALRNRLTDQNKASVKNMSLSSAKSVQSLKDAGYSLQEVNYSSGPPPSLSSGSVKKINEITLSPGLNFLTWDGTFKEINFQ